MHQTVLECILKKTIDQEINFGTGSPDWLEPKSKYKVTVVYVPSMKFVKFEPFKYIFSSAKTFGGQSDFANFGTTVNNVVDRIRQICPLLNMTGYFSVTLLSFPITAPRILFSGEKYSPEE